MASFAERVKHRLVADAWVLDAAKRHPRSRQLRGLIEQKKTQRIVGEAGSIDAALDLIVKRAVAKGSSAKDGS